jgi:hypothetical protein
MMNGSSKQLIIGLPQSGKTTFIAALWHVVQHGEVPTALRLVRLQGERKHLNALRDKWIGYEKAIRTSSGGEASVSMLLEDSTTSQKTDLFLPDLAGESIRSQWVSRKWTQEYDEWVLQATGALVFVHPVNFIEPLRLDTLQRISAELDAADGSAKTTQEASASVSSASADRIIVGGANPGVSREEESASPWNAEESPTQVQLVDLLQLIVQRRQASEPLRLALIVSAWDLLTPLGLRPSEWIERRLPLLDQYLRSNGDIFSTRTYGISAQGGRIPEDISQMKARRWPSERIIVQGESGGSSHDITVPMKWIMQGG